MTSTLSEDMERREIIERIARMPIAFHARDVSIFRLFEEIGGSDATKEISTAELAAVLQDDAGAVDSWVQYSEDQRCSEAWYVIQCPDSLRWEVGFYPPKHESAFFDNPVDACALFIHHLLDQLAEY